MRTRKFPLPHAGSRKRESIRSVASLTRSSSASAIHGGVNTFPWSATRFHDLIKLIGICPRSLLAFVELLDKPALVEFRDETRVHEFLRLVVANVRTGLRDVVVGGFETFGDRIWGRDKVLFEDIVRAFEKFSIRGPDVFGQDL